MVSAKNIVKHINQSGNILPDANKRVKGSFSEQIAINFLSKKGYKILSRNYFQKVGEIDIIARYQNTIVFVEVKSTNNRNFLITDLLNQRKLFRLNKVINIWLYKNHLLNSAFRLDFIGIQYDNYKLKSIKHFENIQISLGR